jgi:hypothetical protein
VSEVIPLKAVPQKWRFNKFQSAFEFGRG